MSASVESRTREPRTTDPDAADPRTHEFQAARNRYRLVRRISTGQMASVWRARDAVTGSDVVVKRLEAGSLHDPVARRRLEEEAAVGDRITHPNAVPVIDSVFGQHEAAIVFPYVPGQTLAERLREGRPLEPRAAVAIALDVSDVLASAHHSDIVHRDIKPGNILLSDDGRTRVLDFGISQAVNSAAADESADELTGSGMAIGTLPYMAPEQLTGGRPTPAADVYSLGVVLYEMLSGRRPFHGRSPSEQLVLQSEPPVALDAPSSVTHVVTACLDPIPDRRPDATQVGRALRAWLDQREETEAATEPVAAVAPLRPAPRFRPATLAGVGVLGIGLLIVAGLALTGAGFPTRDSAQPTDVAVVALPPTPTPVPSPTPSPPKPPDTPAPAPAGDGQANAGNGGGNGGGKKDRGKHKGHDNGQGKKPQHP